MSLLNIYRVLIASAVFTRPSTYTAEVTVGGRGSSGQEQAILSAVCALFEKGGFERVTTGELQAFYQQLASLDAPLLPKAEDETEIHRVALISASLSEAQVDVSATRTFRHTRQRRTWIETSRYTGPVSLLLVEGEWRVADVFRDGKSLRQSLFRADLAGHSPNLQILVGEGRFAGDRYVVLTAVATNTGSEPVLITDALLGSSRSGGRTVWREATFSLRELRPGQMTFELQALAAASADPTELRLLFRTDQGLVDVRPADAAAITRWPVLAPLLSTWPMLAFATVVAVTVAVGVATNLAGATLMLLVAAGLHWRPLANAARKRFRRPRSNLVRALFALFAVALILSVSGGARYLANLDTSSSAPEELFYPLLVISAVGAITLRRLPSRWLRGWPFIQLISMAALLAALALLIGYTAPISTTETAAQQQRLGRIAIEALRTGNTTQLRQNTYPDYQQSVTGEIGLYRIAAHLFALSVIGQPTISKGQIQYRLDAGNRAGRFRLTVDSLERNRRRWIWKVVMTGKAHKTIKLS